ncbi:RluA family pseudouridine synthase [Halobacillus karajensis]|uniref:Pseudouridine synthase n=1 Tax=Halobacillus karajensis TaxID=195088 RepID=A0A024P3S8_9BACI|nr:RluA family pseudouridine synthase [Halobacillus karajensis]CDQ19822.1 Ribosomal large subunit pseudouridine synthase D [Halobacillus karajensis]CDQ22282.1 Ribosomal large subunit pseudouridine synthase D [Halobacillus karajensis]CDQ28123.1 Ribosomal large subunit pseudouridine synthase D [Halobacillus karajensis]
MSEHYNVTEQDQSKRIDKLLSDVIADASRSQIQGWLKDDVVLVGGKAVKSNYKVQAGETITWRVPEPEPMDILPEDIDLDIVYEDQDVIVVNKPSGMVIHPAAGHYSGTLVNALLYHVKDLSGINGVERPGIVHRIDKDTSGLLMVAKNDLAHKSLAEQLSKKTVERKYEAIVHGEIPHEYGTIDAPIGRDPKDRQRMAVVEDGREAVTHFRVLRHFDAFTLVECTLETGRTHQIRVHMRYIDHPLAGDPKYGPRKTLDLEGQALHAKSLGFEHPRTGEWKKFEVEAPQEFTDTLRYLETREG